MVIPIGMSVNGINESLVWIKTNRYLHILRKTQLGA